MQELALDDGELVGVGLEILGFAGVHLTRQRAVQPQHCVGAKVAVDGLAVLIREAGDL